MLPIILRTMAVLHTVITIILIDRLNNYWYGQYNINICYHSISVIQEEASSSNIHGQGEQLSTLKFVESSKKENI